MSMIPAWVDMNRLCQETCTCPNTIDNWVAKGILPPGKKRGGKLMWKWAEVDRWLENGPPVTVDRQAEDIRNGARQAAAEARSRL